MKSRAARQAGWCGRAEPARFRLGRVRRVKWREHMHQIGGLLWPGTLVLLREFFSTVNGEGAVHWYDALLF